MNPYITLADYRENILSMVNLLAAAEAAYPAGSERSKAYAKVAEVFGIDHDTFSMVI